MRYALATLTLTLATLAPLTATTPAAAHPDHRTWSSCKYEDGSGQRRCVWDVRHSGNGRGDLSIKIVRGGTDRAVYTEITHRRAKHLLGRNHDALLGHACHR